MSSKITMKSRQSQEVLPPHSRKGPRLAIVREDSCLVEGKPWKRWQDANLPVELLNRIAILVNAKKPLVLQRAMFPNYPMYIAMLIETAWHLDYLQKVQYDNLTPKQLKQIKRIGDT